MGIHVEGASIDLRRTIAWKDGIVGRLTSGVSGLLQKARVKIVHGRAHFRDGKTVEVETEIGQQIIRAETVVIATGSIRWSLRTCLSAAASFPRQRRCR